jgi:hypothetical protein
MERNLVLEPHTVAQLAEIVTEVSRRLKASPNAKPDKDFLAAQVLRLYGLGIRDPKALRQKVWESASRSSKTRARALQVAKNAFLVAARNVHRQRIVIAALARRHLPTVEAETVLTSLLEKSETAREHYDKLCLDGDRTGHYSERINSSSVAAKTITLAEKADHETKTARLREARLLKEAAGAARSAKVTTVRAKSNPKD